MGTTNADHFGLNDIDAELDKIPRAWTGFGSKTEPHPLMDIELLDHLRAALEKTKPVGNPPADDMP